MTIFPTGTATFTNGSKSVTSVSLSSGTLAFFDKGTQVKVESDPVLDIVEATKAINADSFSLAENWPHATGTYNFYATMTAEGINSAREDMRATSAELTEYRNSFSTLLTSTDPTVTFGDTTVVPFGYVIQQGQTDIDSFINTNQTTIDRLRVMEELKRNAVFYADFCNNEFLSSQGLSKLTQSIQQAIDVTNPDGITGIGADGRIYDSGVGNAPIVYDGEGECQGLQTAPSSTNKNPWSEDLSQQGITGRVQVTISPSTNDSPIVRNGSPVKFQRVTVDSSVTSDTLLISDTLPTTTGNTVSYSFFASKDFNNLRYFMIDTGNSDRSIFDLQSGVFANIHPVVIETKVKEVYNGYYISLTFEALSDNVRVGVMPKNNNTIGYNRAYTAGDYAEWIGLQFEEGYPTPYIKTEASQVTRGDVKWSVTSNLSRSAWSAYIEFETTETTAAANQILHIGNAMAVEVLPTRLRAYNNSNVPALLNNPQYEAGSKGKALVSVTPDRVRFFLNGQYEEDFGASVDMSAFNDVVENARGVFFANTKNAKVVIVNYEVDVDEAIALTTLEQ